MAKQSVHVVPHPDGWAVKMEGTKEVQSVHGKQRDAIQAAMDRAQDDELNIVVHRADGQFGEVMNYEDIANGRGAAGRYGSGARLAAADLLPVRSRVSWGAILAGLVLAFATYLLLGALGTAVGLTASQNVGGQGLAIGAAIWAILSLLIALFLGGFVTSRMTVGENRGEAAVYGLLLWGALSALLIGIPGLAASDPGFGGVIQRARAPMASGAGADRPYTAAMFREAGLDVTSAQIANLEEARLASDGPVGAESAAWWTFAGLLLSLVAAVGGAVLGAGPELVLERIRANRRGEGGVPVSTVAVPRDRAHA